MGDLNHFPFGLCIESDDLPAAERLEIEFDGSHFTYELNSNGDACHIEEEVGDESHAIVGHCALAKALKAFIKTRHA